MEKTASQNVMDAIEARAKHFGPMKDASGYAKKLGDCGDLAEVWLRIDGGRIRRASFMTNGCSWSSHCCNVAVSMVEGWKPEIAIKLTKEQVLKNAGDVPNDHQHCAELAADTIKLAIEDFNTPTEKQTFGRRIKNIFKKKEQNA